MNWLRDPAARTRLIGRALLVGLLALSIVRFVSSGLLRATHALNGDFAAVFPAKPLAYLRPDFPDHAWFGWQYGPMVHFLTLPLFLVPRWSLVPSVWAIVNLAAIVASFILVLRLTSVWRGSTVSIVVLAAAWMSYQPLVNCFAQGNIEIVEMAMVLGALVALPRRPGLAGVLISVAAMTKFLPIGFLVWFLLRRYYRAFLSGVATIVVIIVATTFTLGWKDSAIFNQLAVSVGAPDATTHNLTVTSLFLHRTSELLHYTDVQGHSSGPVVTWLPSERFDAAARAGAVASVLLAAGFALVLFLRRHRPASPYEVAVLFMTMFMILPYNEDYYYLFALVPMSVLFRAGVERRDAGLLTTTFVGYVLMSPPIPFSWLDRTGWLPVHFSNMYNYLDLPILGALIVWLAATHRMIVETEDVIGSRERRRAARGKLVWVTAVLIAILGIGVFAATRRGAIAPSAVDALHLQPAVFLSGPPALALAPDGSRLAYVAPRAGGTILCVHTIEAATTTCVPGTEEAAGPFFSADSQWIGFFAGRLLKKVRVDGREVQLISESRGGRSGHWESDDTILLATPTNGIMRVPASGGDMEVVVPLLPTDGPYSWPMLLPSGDTVLFTVAPPGGGFGAGWIVACSLSTGRRTILFPGSQPHFDESTGRLSWTLHGRIVSVAFDPVTLRSVGPFLPAAGDVLVTPDGGPYVAYGGRAAIAYAPGSLLPVVRRQMVWVDRAGAAVPLAVREDAFQTPRVSSDGRTLVVGIRGVTTDLWKYDLATGAEARLTFTAPTNDTPVWAPDGGVAFRVPSGSGSTVLVTPNGGNETDASRLWEGGGIVRLGAWSRDGRTMVGTQSGDLWILSPNGIGESRPAAQPRDRQRTILAQTAPVELGPVLSPDGRYVAYSSDETGRSEIYVQSVTGFSDRRQVSTTGGSEPVWAGHGRELFYRSGDAMMVVSVASQPAFSAGAPRILFRGAYLAGDGLTNYDVSPDGQRFLMIRDSGQAPGAASLTIRIPQH